MTTDRADIAVVGAGAAGLFAAIWASRANPAARVVAFDGAKTLGAKILVAGGGRCNVTHHAVDESAYAGSSRNAVKKVLRRFGVDRTVEFFRERGVTLKREDTGKLFPTTDSSRTVLNALLEAAAHAGVSIVHPWRVTGIEHDGAGGFILRGGPENADDTFHARRVVVCTGGKSLPKSGSDGAGYAMLRALGHTITPRVFPALVPLLLPEGHPLTTLSGLTVPATLEVRTATGKRLISFTNSTLLTHFGLSGPSVLDISRYHTEAAPEGARLSIAFITERTPEQVDQDLQFLGRATVGRHFGASLPERLVRLLCEAAGVEPGTPGAALSRDQRRSLVDHFCRLDLPVRGDRGWNYAEVTAGGVPLSEVRLETMESRVCPGLYLAGEVCDVDGRIGGFNFQWAWASGYVAGTSAGGSLGAEHSGGSGV